MKVTCQKCKMREKKGWCKAINTFVPRKGEICNSFKEKKGVEK